jgi:RNA polymerase sigma-70 factor (ECF subfamily)
LPHQERPSVCQFCARHEKTKVGVFSCLAPIFSFFETFLYPGSIIGESIGRDGDLLKIKREKKSILNESTALHYSEQSLEDQQDIAIIHRTLQEDRNAFRALVEKYTPIFYSLIIKMNADSNRERAEDALQEIFLKIFAALDSFNPHRRFYPWAYTIAINHLRSQGRRKDPSLGKANISYDEEWTGIEAVPHYPSPEQQLINNETQVLVDKALGQIKPVYREVFVLRLMQGLSVTDTARILRLPEGTVKTYLFRAKKEIQEYLRSRRWEL